MAKAILLFANFFTALKHGAIPGQDHGFEMLIWFVSLGPSSPPNQNCLNHDLYVEMMDRIKEMSIDLARICNA
jgi:hypothetical protein